MDVHLKRYESATDFLGDVGEVLYVRATVNNLMLGICERLVQNPAAYVDPFFAAAFDVQGNFLLAAVMTPPHNIILAEGADFQLGLAALVEHLHANQIELPGVIGPVPLAEAFYGRWKMVAGLAGEVDMYQRVYELRQVHLPKMPSGHFRIARKEDIPLIARWMQAFEAEALAEDRPLNPERAARFVQSGNAFVWEDGGQPVAMAMKARPLKSSATVNAVYTPPENRRQGYASALVARLSQHLLDLGYEFVNLFTDLDNPTSNAIYQKIGYHPVTDFRSYRFFKA
jgi:hypothetical protein